MDKLKELIQKMIDFGYTQDQIDQMLDASAMDITTDIISDAIDVLSEEKLNELKTKLESEATVEGKSAIVDEIAKLTYGDQADEKRALIVVKILEGLFEKGKEVKELYNKYQAGDPDAVNKVQAAMKTDEFTQTVKDIQENK
ncbi:hypothetical protein M0R04_03620 [Candidatus Dojkabacteria bacterium]|jgi:hypothetical protein|nr:hypothetical protein [Candidatus Dojkabacteria bacterium]